MPAINRDRDIVEHILRYCNQVETAHQDFGRSKDRFVESTTYQNAISMISKLRMKIFLGTRFAACEITLPMNTVPLILKSSGLHRPRAYPNCKPSANPISQTNDKTNACHFADCGLAGGFCL